MSDQPDAIIKADDSSKQEYIIPIIRTEHGFVKVLARSKNEAERVVKRMNRIRLMQFFKPTLNFLKIMEDGE